jgi:CRISPR-associated exonuclease Cas4
MMMNVIQLQQEQQREEAIPIGISYVNALEYCPRRFYYKFVQGEMLVNEFVLEGTLLHENADQPGRTATDEGEELRHVYVYSEKLGLSGFTDVVLLKDAATATTDADRSTDAAGYFVPVEYKHGRKGRWLNDHVQLCAQALCLQELSPQPIEYGYIFYWSSRRRVRVDFTPELRARTLALVEQAQEIARQTQPPPPLEDKQAARCRDC